MSARKGQLLFGAILLCIGPSRGTKITCTPPPPGAKTVYGFSEMDILEKETIPFTRYTGQQEPEANGTEILNALKYVRPGGGFVPNFQMFKIVDVNGKNEIPLYTYLKKFCGPTSDVFQDGLFYDPKRVSDVRWNFEVFLVNKRGFPVYRFSEDAPIKDIEDAVRGLLQDSAFESKPLVFEPESGDIKEAS